MELIKQNSLPCFFKFAGVELSSGHQTCHSVKNLCSDQLAFGAAVFVFYTAVRTVAARGMMPQIARHDRQVCLIGFFEIFIRKCV